MENINVSVEGTILWRGAWVEFHFISTIQSNFFLLFLLLFSQSHKVSLKELLFNHGSMIFSLLIFY